MQVLTSPQTLLSLSAEIACRNVGIQAENVKLLPLNLKSNLLKLMSKRGMLDAVSLNSLLSNYEKNLDLSESFLDDECLAAARSCHELQKLNINPGKNQVHKFTSQALVDLFPNLSSLTALHMRRCPAVSDNVIASISKNCINLTQLDVGGCCALTDISLDCIAEGLPKLTSLNFSHTQVSDNGITILSQGKCNHCLTELLLNECTKVTEKGISSIFNCCPCMKYLFFHGCSVSEHMQPLLELISRTRLKQIAWTIY